MATPQKPIRKQIDFTLVKGSYLIRKLHLERYQGISLCIVHAERNTPAPQYESRSSSKECAKTPVGCSLGTILLRKNTNDHVPMTFVSFAAAAAIIALCIRLRNKENQKKGGTSKSNRNEQEEKAYEETNTQHPAHLVYGAMPYADGSLCRG